MKEELVKLIDVIIEFKNTLVDMFIESSNFIDNQELMESFIQEKVKEFEETGNDIFGGKSPKEIIGGIEDMNMALQMFELMCRKSDYIPDVVTDKVKSFGNEVADILLNKINPDTIANYDLNSPKLSKDIMEEMESYIGILHIFRDKSFGGAIVSKTFVELVKVCNPSNQMFLEYISEVLSKRIEESQTFVIECIASSDEIGENEEYLLDSLCGIDDEYKNDDIYRCLKNSFLNMPNHALGAVFLGDYGDARAIPCMRKFAMKNLGVCTMDEYYTILATIEKLGGIIEDLLPDAGLKGY